MRVLRRRAELLLCLAVAASSSMPLRAIDKTFTGYARDIRSGALLYIESHFVRDSGAEAEARVVHYRCAVGREPFMRKELRYGGARERPEFTVVDGRNGFSEGLRRTDDGAVVFFRPTASAPLREQKVEGNVALVSDAGFDEFVRRHWRELEAGQTVRFPFLIPSRLTAMNFKLRKHREERIEEQPVSVIRLNLSGMLGWFLPYIEVSYRKSDQVLVRYKGLTNVRNVAGENLVAQIDFPLAERRTLPARSVDLETQRAIPLAARCP